MTEIAERVASCGDTCFLQPFRPKGSGWRDVGYVPTVSRKSFVYSLLRQRSSVYLIKMRRSVPNFPYTNLEIERAMQATSVAEAAQDLKSKDSMKEVYYYSMSTMINLPAHHEQRHMIVELKVALIFHL